MVPDEKNVRLYLDTWLKAATGGKVTVEYSLFQNRAQFKCHQCDMTLTTLEPESANVIDYSIQEFVKIHAHTGGHCAHKWVTWKDGWICLRCKETQISKSKEVTVDFKPVETRCVHDKRTYQAVGGGLYHYAADGGGVCDGVAKFDSKAFFDATDWQTKPWMADEQALTAAKNKYAEQMAEASKTLEEKAKLLQIESQLAAAKAQQQNLNLSEAAVAELLALQKAEQTKLMNLLLLKEAKEKTAQLTKAVTGQHADPVTTKPLRIATGRRFR